jgi:hypothetical protein
MGSIRFGRAKFEGEQGSAMANPDRSVYDPPFDDDLMFDTVDDQETSRGRPLMILLGIVVLLAFAGVVWVAYRQGVDHAANNEPPLLEQPGPTRVAAAPTGSAVPTNPIYDQIDGAPAAAAQPEVIAPAPEEPSALPAAPTTSATPAPSPAESQPDMTTSEIPPTAAPRSAPPAAGIPSEIAGEAPPLGSSVDPLAPGASLPPVVEAPPIIDIAPPAPPKPTAAEIAAAKAEKERLAKIEAAKKIEAARIAEEKRLAQLAAAKPAPAPAAPAIEEPAPTPPSTPEARRGDASRGPTLLVPTDTTLKPPASAPGPSVAAVETPAPSPSSTRSEIVPDEQPAAAAPTPAGGAFVVQIGAFNSMEDAADSWKRVQRTYSSALGGASPEIKRSEVNGATKYRLRAVGYSDRGAAASTCNRLKAAGQACFVAAR